MQFLDSYAFVHVEKFVPVIFYIKYSKMSFTAGKYLSPKTHKRTLQGQRFSAYHKTLSDTV
jgi:hypothetical protein